jgi:hypothetical protein
VASGPYNSTDVALVVVQAKEMDWPETIVEGIAVNVLIVGTAVWVSVTVTVEDMQLPVGPIINKLYWVDTALGKTVTWPFEFTS